MEATVYLEDNEYIALCDLLKLAGLAESGGQAKAFITEGLVLAPKIGRASCRERV